MQTAAARNTGWTPERRARHAEAIRRWKPWEKSTGPKTARGKARVRWNAVKHNNRGREIQDIYEYVRVSRAYLRKINEEIRFRRQNEKFWIKKILPGNTMAYIRKNKKYSNKLLDAPPNVIFLEMGPFK
ncbi:MAG: hypothetical protein IT558_05150, partial [Alphaproteobacteria bacterium]|nr:hypothetical protein [Alphaproteobacteria bacterium]